ncbi:uncharacterized protein LOC106028098 isoform X1 [Cavia porcellus]|uniref:uncharacterized protein LOC106028098 isoform X1 n=1 Tax=Cavia porcellus TaxID=10141 RepID=UPI000661E656|nr:uncharacterized protein LOC106028098 isoform X1 [Cavia porcellus]
MDFNLGSQTHSGSQTQAQDTHIPEQRLIIKNTAVRCPLSLHSAFFVLSVAELQGRPFFPVWIRSFPASSVRDISKKLSSSWLPQAFIWTPYFLFLPEMRTCLSLDGSRPGRHAGLGLRLCPGTASAIFGFLLVELLQAAESWVKHRGTRWPSPSRALACLSRKGDLHRVRTSAARDAAPRTHAERVRPPLGRDRGRGGSLGVREAAATGCAANPGRM